MKLRYIIMNVANIIEKQVLDLYKTTAYQKLNAYYGQSSLFNVLGIERSENRHSAFLQWVLNPKSSHGLGDSPLKKFLALVATLASDEDKCYYYQVRQHLISGNYTLQVESSKTEQSIIELAKGATDDFINVVEVNDKGAFKKDAYNRFDIWMLLTVTFTDDNDQEQMWYLPVIVENKIYSTEGNANDPVKAQTVRYHRAVNILKNQVCPTEYCQPLMVFLTPSGANAPKHNAFVHLTYQALLDHVIQPCAILSSLQGNSENVKVLMDGYVRNLSCPSNNDGEVSKDYTIPVYGHRGPASHIPCEKSERRILLHVRTPSQGAAQCRGAYFASVHERLPQTRLDCGMRHGSHHSLLQKREQDKEGAHNPLFQHQHHDCQHVAP